MFMNEEKGILVEAARAFSATALENQLSLNVVLGTTEDSIPNQDILVSLGYGPGITFVAYLLTHYGSEKTRQILGEDAAKLGAKPDKMIELAYEFILLMKKCDGIYS